MKIRCATPDDIPAMMALERHAVTAAHWNREQYAALFANPGPRRVALVIAAGTDIQGFLVARAVGSEWEIENIAVAGPARRRGLGTRLLGEFLEQARAEGAEAVLLEVRESNRAARGLYEKWAFVEDGRRKTYYRDPDEDAVLYRLRLT
ncbi:MAG TPA: ribosomal protein S18-alanine N-acetyltransferase [Terriglobales bacterium]|nr:ribosomal protein S18-alanine N-acetyltransferase [Terriglobales bacterium]